jgi:hypothetical protein
VSARPPRSITPGDAAIPGTTADPADPGAQPGTGGTTAPPPAAGNAGEAAAAGSAGAAGGASENVRQSLIDAAIEALGGGASDAGEPWRRGGQQGGGLSADFVQSVLLSMVASGVCFRDVRRCVEMCLVIATDCKPCAADPECSQTFKTICGETIGSCGMP